MKDIIELLNWRYATKRMTGEKVPENQIDIISETSHLAPSGIGLRPYDIFDVTDPEIKKQILPIAMNQAPVTESSHLLIFAVWDQ